MKTFTILAFTVLSVFVSCNVKSENGFPFNIIPKEGKGIIKTKQFLMNFQDQLDVQVK